MNNVLKYLLLSIAFVNIFFSASAQSSPSVKELLDSLEVLKGIGAVAFGHSIPPSEEEKRIDSIETLLRCLPYKELKKLMRDKHQISRAYGFGIATLTYLDSITPSDKYIFEDTSVLKIYTKDGIIESGMTLGEFSKKLYESSVEEKRFAIKRPLVVNAVKSFILHYAKSPKSYVDKGFVSYDWEDRDGGNTYYFIVHRYSLLNRGGEMIQSSDRFVLNKDLNVVAITDDNNNETNFNQSKKGEWLKQFGKE